MIVVLYGSWFGAEEQGLLGSQEVVRVGLQRDNDQTARNGSRARDWAIMIDLDMLGSLNYQNWVRNSDTNGEAGQNCKVNEKRTSQYADLTILPFRVLCMAIVVGV